MALLDAEVQVLTATAGPSPLDWRRLRRAKRRVLAARVRLFSADQCVPAGPEVA